MASSTMALVRKDLLRQFRDTKGLLIYLAAPLLLTFIMGMAFGGGIFGDQGISVIPVALSGGDLPDAMKERLADGLQESGFFTVTWTDSATAGWLVERGKVQASLVLPDELMDRMFTGRDVVLKLERDPNSPIKAGIVEMALTSALRTWQANEAAYRTLWPDDSYEELTQLQGPVRELFSGDPRRMFRALREDDGTLRSSILDRMDRSLAFSDAMAEPPISLERHDRQDWNDQDDGEAGNTATAGQMSGNLYDLFLPAFAVFFMMWSAAGVVRELHRERENRTLARLLCGPVSVRSVILAKWLTAVITGSSQMLVLLLLGGLLFNLNVWHAPGGIVLATVATAASAASVYLVLGLMVRTEKALDALTTVFTLVCGMLGGNFFPVDAMSPGLTFFGQATFNYWANRAFSDLVTHSRGPGSIVPELGALVAVAVVGLLVAVSLITLRQRKGVLA